MCLLHVLTKSLLLISMIPTYLSIKYIRLPGLQFPKSSPKPFKNGCSMNSLPVPTDAKVLTNEMAEKSVPELLSTSTSPQDMNSQLLPLKKFPSIGIGQSSSMPSTDQ